MQDTNGTHGGGRRALLERAARLLAGAARLLLGRPVRVGAAAGAAAVVVIAFVWAFGGWGPEAVPGAGVDVLGGDFIASGLGPAIRLRRVGFVWSFRRKGRLEPLEERAISNQWSGTIKTVWPDGGDVKKGDLVFELDTQEVDRDIASEEAKMVVMKAQFVQTERRQAKLIKAAEQELRRAELELEWQKLNERTVLAGASTEVLARAGAALKTRTLVARNREEEVRMLDELAAQGFATATELGQKKLQLTEARLDLEKARIGRDELLAGPTDLERKEASLQVKIAEYSLDSARKKHDSVKAVAASAVALAERRLKRQENDILEERASREKHFSRSPADGYVLHTPPFYLSELKPGQRLWRGMKVMSLPMGGKIKVATKVTQTEVDHVAVGTECRVTVPARPGRTYAGEVVSVSRQGQDEFADLDRATREKVGESGRQAFAVEVKLLDDDPVLKTGFRAEVEFVIEEVESALVVPWGAVTRGLAGLASVTVVERGRPVERDVKLGASNGHAVVVESGCKEGEVVLLARGGG